MSDGSPDLTKAIHIKSPTTSPAPHPTDLIHQLSPPPLPLLYQPKGERAKEAKRLIKEMEDRWGLTPSLVTYNSLVDALAHTGRWKEAIEVGRVGGVWPVGRLRHLLVFFPSPPRPAHK